VLRAFTEFFEIVRLAIAVDRDRATRGPVELTRSLRARGAKHVARSTRRRASLQRTIRVVDRLFPSGPNCYRRSLVEIGMDAGAAAEPLYMGLTAAGGSKSGHAWLASSPDPSGRYDAEFVV
jgi:hypothetical protein